MMPDNNAANKKNGHNLILSAKVPETIDTVVAQNTIWKYQSEPSEYPVSILLPSDQGINLPINPPSGIPYARLYPNNQNIIPAIENNPIFFAQITDTLLEVTIPDSSMANPAAINITKNPQTKNKNVLNMNPTSAETVVSAAAGIINQSNKPKDRKQIFFIKLII